MTQTPTKPNPSSILTEAATKYAAAKASEVVTRVGQRASGTGPKKDQDPDKKGFMGATAEKLGEGASPIKSAVSGLGTSIKEGVGGLFKRKGGSKRPHNIVEEIIVGVPPDVCWAAYTQWEEFPSFMKGPTNVNRGDETPEDQLEDGQHPMEGEETNWTAKIFMSTRSWKATTVDYDPPKRISWTSEGAKGSVDGTITFTPIGDNATLMAVEIEYRSKGPVEWMGQRWHTVGKRVRLDMKHFRRYVMRTEPDDLPDLEDSESSQETDEQQEQPQDQAQEPQEGDQETMEVSEDQESPEQPEAPESPSRPQRAGRRQPADA